MIEIKIPLVWENDTLANIVKVIRGVTYDKNEAIYEPLDGYVPLVRANNIQNAKLLKSTEFKIDL